MRAIINKKGGVDMESSLKVLKELRKKRKMTQNQLAEIMNVAPNTISTWEQGNREPSFSDLKKLADIFNVSLDFLLSRNNVVQCPSLSKEQEKLLNDYQGLSKPNRQIISTVLSALVTQQAAKVFGSVINNNNSGNGTFITNQGDNYNFGV